MKALSTLTLAFAMAAASPVLLAQEGAHHGHHGQDGIQGTASAELTDGEVKKIDEEAGKITMRHGDIRNLNMPAMTMVLRVKDPSMLAQVKVGDKVRFAADRIEGAVTIVQLEKVQ